MKYEYSKLLVRNNFKYIFNKAGLFVVVFQINYILFIPYLASNYFDIEFRKLFIVIRCQCGNDAFC